MGRPKTEKQPARLTVTLDEQDYSAVCTLAAKNDVSAAWVIRRAVQQYLHPAASQAELPAPQKHARGQS
ncbi:MAG: ribbon-helix-helix protein, CopG family [Bosea sp. (in: a-proteobacteria)]